MKTESNGAIKKCMYHLVVGKVAPGFVSHQRPLCQIALHQCFISLKEWRLSLPHHANVACCLCLVCFFHRQPQAWRLNAKRPGPSEGPISITKCLSESRCFMFEQRWISVFSCLFFGGSSGKCCRPNLLAPVSATRVPLQGKQCRPIEKEAPVTKWNIDLSGSSCRCQKNGEADAPRSPPEALPGEKETAYLNGAKLGFLPWNLTSQSEQQSLAAPNQSYFGMALLRNFPQCSTSVEAFNFSNHCTHTTHTHTKWKKNKRAIGSLISFN